VFKCVVVFADVFKCVVVFAAVFKCVVVFAAVFEYVVVFAVNLVDVNLDIYGCIIVVDCVFAFVVSCVLVVGRRVDISWDFVVIGTRGEVVALDLSFEWGDEGKGLVLVVAKYH